MNAPIKQHPTAHKRKPIIVHGHPRAVTMLQNMLRQNNLHHALFLSGPAQIGKSTTVQALLHTLYCESPLPAAEGAFSACFECAACLRLQKHQHPAVLSISLDDRLPVIHSCQTLLSRYVNAEPSSQVPATLVQLLLSECYRLIARHSQGRLSLLKRKKVSYPGGVVLSVKEREAELHQLYNLLAAFTENKQLSPLLTSAALATLRTVQNSIDRTLLSKESIDSLLAWTTQSVVNRHSTKTLIIKGIEKIHYSVIGKFLKSLEDPPPQTRFILITENPAMVTGTVLAPLASRCFKVNFLPLSGAATAAILKTTFHVQLPAVPSLTNFLAAPAVAAGSRDDRKLAFALLSAAKTKLSYLHYLARTRPQENELLLTDLKAALQHYLEHYFITTTSAAQTPAPANPGTQKLVRVMRAVPFSFRKCLTFNATLNHCERLKNMGILSGDALITRLSLFIRENC